MRRPHVYERSAPRARRTMEQEGGAALPDLLKQAEAAGAVALTRYLGQALSEAEGIVGRVR